MKLILDTHTLLWWDAEPWRLSAAATAAINDPANDTWASVINPWEIAIKFASGKLALHRPLPDIVATLKANGLRFLPMTEDHALALLGLPAPHNDPFDRALAAQAIAEGAALVTSDHIFARYPVRVVW